MSAACPVKTPARELSRLWPVKTPSFLAGVPTGHFHSPPSWPVSPPDISELILSWESMVEPFKYSGGRKSHQSFKEVYFWTSVIKDWKHLLGNDDMKMIMVESF